MALITNPTLKYLSDQKKLWVAYSGGLDSHVLLHYLSSYSLPVKAIHIHHGLSKKADEWVIHCQTICTHLNIPLQINYIQLEVPHKNIEAVAREKRYAVFSSLIDEQEALVTGHHQDDQAETLLLQLFRGAGLKGLSAMPESIPFSKGMLIRPFLAISKSELQRYAQKHQLQWIEDDSNQQIHFHRNFLRHQVLPLIQSRWPSISKTLARSAKHNANAQQLLETLAQQDLQELLTSKQTLAINKLLTLPLHRQQNAIRSWLTQLGFSLPPQQQLVAIQATILNCKPDAAPLIAWGNTVVRRYRNELYAMQARSIPQKETHTWPIQQSIEINGILFSKEGLLSYGIQLSGIQIVTIRFRQGGERCRLQGHTHSKSLKKLFQEWGIPPWERDHIPLIYHENQLMVIWGHALCETSSHPSTLR